MPCQGLLFFWNASSSEKSASWLLRVRRVATGKELAANVGQPVCIEGDLSTRNPLLVESQTRRGAEEAVLHAVKEEAKYKRRAVRGRTSRYEGRLRDLARRSLRLACR